MYCLGQLVYKPLIVKIIFTIMSMTYEISSDRPVDTNNFYVSGHWNLFKWDVLQLWAINPIHYISLLAFLAGLEWTFCSWATFNTAE